MKAFFVLLGVAVLGFSALAGCKAEGKIDTDGKASTPLSLPR